MASKRSRRLFRNIALTSSLVLFLALVQVLFDPLSLAADLASTLQIRRELPRAREKWQSLGPASYRIAIKGMIPMACTLDGQLTIRDGQLVEVRLHENPLVAGSPLVEVERGQWQSPACSFEELTIEGMFARVESDLNLVGAGLPLRVEFDQDYGYITAYHFGRSHLGGILGSTVSECCTWFEYGQLEVLAP